MAMFATLLSLAVQATQQLPSKPAAPPTGEGAVSANGTVLFQAEDYSGGFEAREGRDYHDTTPENAGRRYRNDGVDIAGRPDRELFVYATQPGEWLRYRFSGGGRYEIQLRHLSRGNPTAHVEIDGTDVTGAIRLLQRADGSWGSAITPYFELEPGEHDVRFIFDTGNVSLDWFRLLRITVLPVPDEGAQKESRKTLRELFVAEYAKRGPDDRKVLARTLMNQGRRTPEATPRFVLLSEAADVAAEAGDAGTAFAAIQWLERGYRIDPFALKAEALAKARRIAKTPAVAAPLTQSYLSLIDEGADAERFEETLKLIPGALAVAKAARNPSLQSQVKESGDRLVSLALQFRPVKSALARLEKNPKDARANLTVGQYRCFVRDDWERGVPRLARGSDKTLARPAGMELERPADAAARAAVARAWAEAGKRKRGDAGMALARRALHWFEEAVAVSAGIGKLKLELEAAELRRALVGGGIQTSGLLFWVEPSRDAGSPFRDHAGGARARELGSVPYVGSARALDTARGSLEYPATKGVRSVASNGSILAWIQSPNFNQYGAVLYRSDARVADFGLHTANGGRLGIYLNFPANKQPFYSRARLTNGQWAHAAVTWDDRSIVFYVDGKKDAVVSHRGAPTVRTSTLLLGEVRQGQGQRFRGRIGAVLLYGRTLPAGEIVRHFAATRGSFGK